MISIKALGMYSSDFSDGWTRNGDTQIATDGKYYDVIDGGCDRYATRLITSLKTRNVRNPYLHISHCHYDHRDGIDKILSDPWFTPRGLYCQDPDSITAHNSEIRSDINALQKIIDKAKSKDIPVIYLGNEDAIEHGEIKITVYRQYPKYTGNSDAYLNDGSLCYWFAAQRYLTTGDASMWCAYKYNLNPLIVKGGHHGNDMSADEYLKPSQMCPWLYKHGCLYYWDNDFSTRLTDFLMTGREDAINAGMTFIDIHGDIDMAFAEGKVTIIHGGQTYTHNVPYQVEMLKSTWEKGTKGMWYKHPDGSWATGWALIDGKWYYFDKDGWLQTGWKKLKWSKGEDWFFFDFKNGAMKTGWHKLPWSKGENWFYFNGNGAMQTGWKWLTKDGKTGWYYLEGSGAMHIGWIFDDGAWYYLGADGKMVTGWVTYKGKKCYLEPKSDKNHVQGTCYVNRTAVIDGKTYRFDKDGYATEEKGGGTSINRSKKIIDISEFQGDVNWSKASSEVGAVYIRCGLRGSLKNTAPADYKKIRYDRKWARNLSAVQTYGIPFSAYYFPTAITDAEALEGAKWFYEQVKDLNLAFPPALDSENVWGNGREAGRANGLSKSERTRLLKIVTDYFNERGMNIGIYASASWLNSKIDMSAFPQCVRDCTWVADSTGAVDYNGYYWLHQYGKGACAGFNDDIDLNRITGTIPPARINAAPAVQKTESPIDVAISIAESYLGYHEGANNKTIFGDTMHKVQPSNMDLNAAWCDAFVDFVILKTCEHFGKGAETARMVLCGDFDDYTYNSVALYKKAGRWFKTPLRGDQIFFGGSGHTGIVTAVESGIVKTIEGNKSDQVKACSYSTSSPSIIGYGRPRYDLITGQVTAEDMPYIKRGSRSDAVKKLQELLNAKGYKLSVDGDFGPATEAAVKAYQAANHLTVDGEVGEKTWGSLMN